MNTHILNVALQLAMFAGLLSIVFLLLMPTLPFFQKKPTSNNVLSVLEINDSLTGNQQLIIARTKKLSEKKPGPHIEVVASGDGIGLLFSTSPYRQEILSLISKGVIFTVCQKSLRQLETKIHRSVDVLSGVRFANDGHVYAEQLKDNGYIDELI